VSTWTTQGLGGGDKDLQRQPLSMQTPKGSLQCRLLPEVPESLSGA